MKRVVKILFILTFAVCIFSSCVYIDQIIDTHSCRFSEWDVLSEPTCENVGYEDRYCLDCGEYQTRSIEKLPHTPVTFIQKEPTCTKEGKTAGEHCSVCMKIISGIETIPALGHEVVIDPAVEPTAHAPGRTEGSHCAVCNEVIVKQTSIYLNDFANISAYHSNYGFNSLISLSNGSAMQDFYSEIDEAAYDFHDSINDAKERENDGISTYYVAEIIYSDNGLTSDEAITVWNVYLKDHPLYYWMSNVISYSYDYVLLTVYEEYRLGEVREEINEKIYNAVEEYVSLAAADVSIYNTTLAFHDTIIEKIDYAYGEEGTPSLEPYAHNIVGAFVEGEGVCESYAKAFQLLLNYCDIENVFVTGYANEPHAWNLVKLDNDEWYWYDLTWDDQPSWMLGVRHNYFCVTDDSLVDYIDGYSIGETTFLEDHVPDLSGGIGVKYTYKLPGRAKSPYDSPDLQLRDDIIEQNGLYFVLIGYKTLALINIEAEGEVNIPATVSYLGTEYFVRCIGKYDEENGLLYGGSVIYYNTATRDHVDVTSIYIPETIEFIWDYAFDHCYTIQKFYVNENNPKFNSVDGVLFTKNLFTLIKYPLASSLTSYTVPEQTAHIAYGAFGDGGNVFKPQYLKKLVFPRTVKVVGVVNAGKGYFDAQPLKNSDVVKLDGYTSRLYLMLGSGFTMK